LADQRRGEEGAEEGEDFVEKGLGDVDVFALEIEESALLNGAG
jgi:hypothetical protein